MEVSLCATHTATARAQMGAGCCLGSSLEERVHAFCIYVPKQPRGQPSGYGIPKNPQCATSGGRGGRGGPYFSPRLSSPASHHEHQLVTKYQVAR